MLCPKNQVHGSTTCYMVGAAIPRTPREKSAISKSMSPLWEKKKTWLHDDYVRFLRYAHWQIERNQAGCLAMVLNAGFIDNLTFRGVRYQLLKSFDQVEVINFGGDHRNARNQQDENLFGIETAIATLIASFDSGSHQSKSPAPVRLDSVTKPLSKIRYLRIDGGVKKKEAWCFKLQPKSR